MADNGNTKAALLIGLIMGAFSAAVFTLLLTPEAGEELQQKIASGVETNWQKASQELDCLKQI